tara:strand:- start:34 stop:1593 length:1560 start_codon:yes stop_codon:yes gene_type:complete
VGISRKFGNLAHHLESGSSGDFLTTDDSGGLFRVIDYSEISGIPTILDSSSLSAYIDSAYVQLRQTDVGLDSALTASLVDSAYVLSRQSETGIDSAKTIAMVDSAYVDARISAGLDSAKTINLVDSSYVNDRLQASSGFEWYRYSATANQTVFQDSDIRGNVLSYSQNGVLVFYNGVLLDDTVDYTAVDGSKVTLNSNADSGVSINIAKWATGPIDTSIAWGGGTGLFGGGTNSFNSRSDIEAITIQTTGNTTDFGDLTTSRNAFGSMSNGSRGVWVGGDGNNAFSATSIIDYVTISTSGNASTFGNATNAFGKLSGCSDGSRGVYGSGKYSFSDQSNTLEYITIASTGNGSDFGDLSQAIDNPAMLADATYGVRGGGYTGASSYIRVNVMDYWTIQTTGNASDFGDLTQSKDRFTACSSPTRGMFNGGSTSNSSYENVIEYITISTPGNGSDFGDLTSGRRHPGSCSDGERAVVASGETGSSTRTQDIDYYAIATLGNASSFGSVNLSGVGMAGLSGD